MKGGFPKGFGIALTSHRDSAFSCQFKKDEVFRFSLLLYGHFADYRAAFTQAVEKMCANGIGKPRTPFRLVAITEKPFLRLSDLAGSKTGEHDINIQYTVPVSLYNDYNIQGIPDRQHEFPGFHALVRSCAHRIAKLSTLYTCPGDKDFHAAILSSIDPFAQYALTVVLHTASLQRIAIVSTPKKGTSDRILLGGYTGALTFVGNFNYYLPLLYFMQPIGAGHNTTYGLGRFEIVK
jgi:hypothetical protein